MRENYGRKNWEKNERININELRGSEKLKELREI